MSNQRGLDERHRDRVIAALNEFIEALDRRVPNVESMGEFRIAREAATLRSDAVTRIDELKRAGSDRHMQDTELAEAVMTDEGGPPRKDEGRRDTSAAEIKDIGKRNRQTAKGPRTTSTPSTWLM